jgi:cytochrome c-type biogenesis protein CcmF
VTEIGELALWVALLMTTWSCLASFVARRLRREDLALTARRALIACFVSLLVALTGVTNAFVTRDFTRAVVVAHSDANLPLAYTVAATWAGSSGWVMLVAAVLVGFSVVLVGTRATSPLASARSITAIALSVLVALFVVCLFANPFGLLDFGVTDGEGLAPRLQNIGFMIVPPLEALAFAASAVACVVMREDGMIRGRRALHWWRLASVLLILALAARVWWTYTALDGARFWQWSIGASATLALWLIANAIVHDAASPHTDGDRGKIVLIALAILAVAVGIVAGGPFSMNPGASMGSALPRFWLAAGVVAGPGVAEIETTRSGVRAKAGVPPTDARHWLRNLRDGAHVGYVALIFLTMVVAAAALIPVVDEWVHGDASGSAGPVEVTLEGAALVLLIVSSASLRSLMTNTRREALRYIAVPLVLSAAVVALLAFLGVTSLYVLLVALVATCALVDIIRETIGGGRATLPRGLVHLGVVVATVGLCFWSLTTARDFTVRSGESVEIRDPFGRPWKLTGQGVSLYDVLNRRVVAVTVEAFRGEISRGLVKTEKRQTVTEQDESLGDPLTGVGIRHTALVDLRLELLDVSGEVAKVRVAFVPFAALVWLGASLVILGELAMLLFTRRGDV